MTAEEFAVWAEARPEKHWELFDGELVLQQSQNWGHARHVLSLAMAFRGAIAAQRFGLFVGTQGLVVKAGPHTAFEPDVVVFAGPMDDHDIIVPPPVIVVEVLSDSTARKDRTVKLEGYFAVPAIKHYLIADWEEREIIHHRREGSGLAKPIILREGFVLLDPPGLRLALAEIFGD
jgi:Uma2 family endonuclease